MKNFLVIGMKLNQICFFKRCEMPYLPPLGFIGIGLNVNKFDEDSCVAYHGTTIDAALGILKHGFRLPSEPGMSSREGSFRLNCALFGVDNYADAVFVSPSLKYATLFGIQNSPLPNDSENEDFLIVVLQVRVKLGSYLTFPNTTYYLIDDPHYKDEALDWRISNPKDLFPYRILFKKVTKNEINNIFRKKKK